MTKDNWNFTFVTPDVWPSIPPLRTLFPGTLFSPEELEHTLSKIELGDRGALIAIGRLASKPGVDNSSLVSWVRSLSPAEKELIYWTTLEDAYQLAYTPRDLREKDWESEAESLLWICALLRVIDPVGVKEVEMFLYRAQGEQVQEASH